MKHLFQIKRLKTVSLASILVFNFSIPQLPVNFSPQSRVSLNSVSGHLQLPEDIPLIAPVTKILVQPLEPSEVDTTSEIEESTEVASIVIEKQKPIEAQEEVETPSKPEPTPTPQATAEPTPTATPEILEQVVETTELFIETPYDSLYQEYADRYSIEVNQLKKIAACESGHNATSVNGDYLGMFQFSSSTWQSTRNQMGLDPNPELRLDPIEAIHTAAFKIGAGGIRAWASCL